jgi:hypothetical protein
MAPDPDVEEGTDDEPVPDDIVDFGIITSLLQPSVVLQQTRLR